MLRSHLVLLKRSRMTARLTHRLRADKLALVSARADVQGSPRDRYRTRRLQVNMRTVVVIIAVLGLLTCGCEALVDFLRPDNFTVIFVNESPDHDVDLTLASAEDEDTPEDLIELLGDERSYSVGPEASITRQFSCDSVGALMVENAELQSPILQPDTQSEVLRRGEDFECGGTIVFTFTHSAALVDFDVSVSSGPL
jgi:hypothetical protein